VLARGDASPLAGSLTGKIALIERGTCNWREGVQRSARRSDRHVHLQQRRQRRVDRHMGAGVHADDVTIPLVADASLTG
jgi:hypothetical protein